MGVHEIPFVTEQLKDPILEDMIRYLDTKQLPPNPHAQHVQSFIHTSQLCAALYQREEHPSSRCTTSPFPATDGGQSGFSPEIFYKRAVTMI